MTKNVDAAGPLGRGVRQREYMEWAQNESDRQRRIAHEEMAKLAQFENEVCVLIQQAAALNGLLVMSMFCAALSDA